MHLVEVNPLIFARTEAKFRRTFDGVDAVAALDALQHMLLPRVVRRGVQHIHAGLVDGNRSSDAMMPMSAMQGFSATAQQSQSTDRFFITLM